MPDFSPKMYQIQFSTGVPHPARGKFTALPRLIVGFGEKGREKKKGSRERI